MTAVCSTYIFVAPEGLGMDVTVSQTIGCIITAITLVAFLWWKKKNKTVEY